MWEVKNMFQQNIKKDLISLNTFLKDHAIDNFMEKNRFYKNDTKNHTPNILGFLWK